VDINSYTVSAYGGFTYSPVVEILGPPGFPSTFYYNVLNERSAGPANGAGLNVSGLPLDYYTVRFRNRGNDTNSYILVNSIDVITPVYAPITNKTSAFQNTQMIGSTSLKDERNFEVVPIESEKSKAYAVALGINANPTTSVTSYVPLPNMSCTVETDDGYLLISYSVLLNLSTVGVSGLIVPYIDGTIIPIREVSTKAPTAGFESNFSNTFIVPVTKGSHKIDLYWRSNFANVTITAASNIRILTVKEL
jgi:hypothetical protein